MATTQQFNLNSSGHARGLSTGPTGAEIPPPPATMSRIWAKRLSNRNARFHEGLDVSWGDAALERSARVLTGVPDHPFYEFALCLRKVASPQPHNSSESWSFRVSNTLRAKQKHSI